MMYYGAQYYRPPFPMKDCWERDMKNMKELGFNVVKLWAVWNWIEKIPGDFDFSELDELIIIAKKNNLGVIINVIPEGAPYWTSEGNEDAYYETKDGLKITYGGPANLPSGGWPGLCLDNPKAEELVTRFLEKTAEHYKNETSIVSMDVWNEPHLEPMYDYREDILCYCEHSKKQFILWLKNKYGLIEHLNTAWFRTYRSWTEVVPPPRFGTWADMMDWRLFWLENLQRWLRIRVEAIKRGAPNIKTQTHVAYSGYLGNDLVGGLANELGDEFLLAKEVDIFGLTSFPKWLMKKDQLYKHMMHNEMVAEASDGKCFYQVELQGGGGKAGLLGGETPKRRDIILWNYHTVLMGGKGSVYWQYAPEPSGIEAPGFGLTGLLGENTERSLAAGECAKLFNNSLLDQAVRVKPSNAIYISRQTEVLTYSAGKMDRLYVDSINGIYKAAYRNGIPMGFLHADHVNDIAKQGVKVLYLPMLLALSKNEIESLYSFVKQGGTLISEACPGLFDEAGTMDNHSYALEKLFGLKHFDLTEIPVNSNLTFSDFNNINYPSKMYHQMVKPLTAEILGLFNDSTTAYSVNNIGEGKAYWFGTYVFNAYQSTENIFLESLLMSYVDRGGYGIIEKIVHHRERTDELQAPVLRLLETEDQYIIVGVNHYFDEVVVDVYFTKAQKLSSEGAKETMLTLNIEGSGGTVFSWSK